MAAATKLEGLASYTKYQSDVGNQLWQQLYEHDEQDVRQLVQLLTQARPTSQAEGTVGSSTEPGDGRLCGRPAPILLPPGLLSLPLPSPSADEEDIKEPSEDYQQDDQD